MYGNNPVVGPRPLEAGFLIKKIWFTIQGEGPFAGRPAIFVRFSGCNLRCTFCDTDFQGGEECDLHALTQILWEKMEEHSCPLLVFTGGEPMLQEILAVAQRLITDWSDGAIPAKCLQLPRPHVQIETAGTVWPEWPKKDEPRYNIYHNGMFGYGGFVTLVCSPKTPKVHPLVAKWCRHWKYIIKHNEISVVDGLPHYSTQSLTDVRCVPLFRGQNANSYRNIIYVQPCDENRDTDSGFGLDPQTILNIQEAVKSSMRFGYTLSIQTHKIAGVE